MDEDLNELQRRMLSRRQQHHAQCAIFNGLALVAATILMGFILVYVREQPSPLELGIDANYLSARIGAD